MSMPGFLRKDTEAPAPGTTVSASFAPGEILPQSTRYLCAGIAFVISIAMNNLARELKKAKDVHCCTGR